MQLMNGKHGSITLQNGSRRSVAETTEQQNGSKSIFNSDVHASRKRPKLEIRRGETGNASQMESDTENTHVMNGLVLWDGIVVEEKESNELSQGQDRNINESVMKKPFGFGNKSQQCIAFIESKGRQCEERHHVQIAEKCMLLQCIPCGRNFGDKEQLLTHVQAVHPSECSRLTSGESIKTLKQGLHISMQKHMEPSSVRLSRPDKFKKSLGAVSYRIRNMKRRKQDSKPPPSPPKSETTPSNHDILSAARSACCRLSSVFAKEKVQHRCVCPGSVCSPLTCDHVYLFGNDFEEARDVYGKSMRCRFPYDDKERIILTSWRRFILFMNAMNSADALGHVTIEFYRMESALNLKFLEQKARCETSSFLVVSIYLSLLQAPVYMTDQIPQGWGVRACEHILRGTSVCEYIGEVLDQQEADKRRI
ncbi:hypothetical protein HID58_036101, partial [Brassica napus]